MRGTLKRFGQRLKADEGYTLTEMLVVIAVIALIAAVVTPGIFGNMQRARSKNAQMQVQTIATAVEAFRADVGRYPDTGEGLAILLSAPAGLEGWTGPYVKDAKYLQDPWGHTIDYTPTGDAQGFTVRSRGGDNAVGGNGTGRDLVAP